MHLSRLRAALGPDRERLSRDGSGDRFAIEPHELDASRFADLVDDGCAALDRGDAFGAHAKLSEALDLWRGPVLADLAGESFVHAEATRLEELRLLALERRAAAGLDLGRHDLIIEELRALVDRYPFRERFWEQLMLALYRARRQAEALRTFEEARTRLIDELGITPDRICAASTNRSSTKTRG